MLVPWQFGMPQELGRVFVVGITRLKEALPIMGKLHQDLLAHLCRKGFVRVMRLHTPLYFIVVEVLPLMDKGLTYLIQCGIVQVL